MKLQRTTWILLLSACFLGGVVYLYEGIGQEQRQTAETAAKRLFSIPKEEDLIAVKVQTAQYTLDLQRNPTRPHPSASASTTPTGTPSGTATPTPSVTPTASDFQWMAAVEAPATQKAAAKAANDATVTFLTNLLVTGERQPLSPDDASKNVLTIPANQRQNFGLTQPVATIDLRLKDGKTHRLLLGQANFNNTALYAEVDPPATPGPESKLVLVPNTFENAVKRPLSEWFPAPSTPTSQPTSQPSTPTP